MKNKEIILKYLIEEKDKLYKKIINSNEKYGIFLDDVANFTYIIRLIINLSIED